MHIMVFVCVLLLCFSHCTNYCVASVFIAVVYLLTNVSDLTRLEEVAINDVLPLKATQCDTIAILVFLGHVT